MPSHVEYIEKWAWKQWSQIRQRVKVATLNMVEEITEIISEMKQVQKMLRECQECLSLAFTTWIAVTMCSDPLQQPTEHSLIAIISIYIYFARSLDCFFFFALKILISKHATEICVLSRMTIVELLIEYNLPVPCLAFIFCMKLSIEYLQRHILRLRINYAQNSGRQMKNFSTDYTLSKASKRC